MNAFEKAKSQLPNMPTEVFDAWLRPIIKDHGIWPYEMVHSPHPNSQWRDYFGHFSLKSISECRWDKMSNDFNSLDQMSHNTIDFLIETHAYDIKPNIKFNVHNSRHRFYKFVKYILEKRKIPETIIGVKTSGGLRILDGNHRLAALSYINMLGKIECETWVGTLNEQEKIDNEF